MEWEKLDNIKPWFSLKDHFPCAKHVENDLYVGDNDQYLLTSPVNRDFKGDQPGAPFVTIAFWAQSEAAARRCALKDLSVPVSLTNKIPPPFFLFGTDGSYGELLKCKRVKSLGRVSERAVYHGTTGVFVHKIIDATKFIFCFLELNIRYDEKPYAIEFRF